jgi:2,3-bisphosphoglycerate-dependent phosphoglycerate mutase
MRLRALAAITAITCLPALASPALAQSTVFVVRHAERADAGTPVTDPDLSAAGHARAEALASALRDAGITAIFVTQLKRTQQTAAPLAKALGLTPVVLPQDNTAGLIARLEKHTGNALVVGHSNTVPEIVKLLGVSSPVTVGDTEFDHLFVVVRPVMGAPSVILLRYR